MAGQLTLALIKPHITLGRSVGKIITKIENAGFGIVLSKMLQLRKEGAFGEPRLFALQYLEPQDNGKPILSIC